MTTPFTLPATEYALLDLLDRLEAILEDLDEFGLTTRAQVEALMDAAHARLDALEHKSGAS